MKTYILTKSSGETKEVKADWFDFNAEFQTVGFHKTGQDCAVSAFSCVESVEEKPE